MMCEKTNTLKGDRDCIRNQIIKIDQEQKEAIMAKECDTCATDFLQRMFNTRPISFFLECGKPFCVSVPCSQDVTSYFRIEEVKGDCVLLRILEKEGHTWDCTDFTVLLKMDCICALQCFPPIWCEKCRGLCLR